jgi:Domain of unknown function (DUF4190)/GYF domain 2
MQILVHRHGQQLGPFSVEQLRAALASGTVSAEDLAWWEGAPAWTPVRTVPGIDAMANPGAARSSDGSVLAIASLILGVLSCCAALFTGIPAVICGHLALVRKKRAGIESGKGIAIVGLVTGYFGIVFITVVWLLAAIAVPSFRAAKERAQGAESIRKARNLFDACRVYAGDHDGNFPATLDGLEPDYLSDASNRRDPLAPEFGDDGFNYFGGKATDPMEKVIITSKGKTRRGERVVLRANGDAGLERYSLPADL